MGTLQRIKKNSIRGKRKKMDEKKNFLGQIVNKYD
jgi:hypothetical protein